ncbi:MAG: squalene/phytoene synthase family protein [Gloeobacteraceae cyanobacterium ES-bin-144]|nr:squalene/phytoene synthase family protein [Verrucomicrobiales bacterium]
MQDAAQITRRAKSNLAFALRIMPRERRNDMVVFYAFCRLMDDLADAPGIPTEQRLDSLQAWKNGLVNGFSNPSTIQSEVIELRDRREIKNEFLIEIIEGCEMDLQAQRFQTWSDLSDYVWKVACAVGLVSIRLFGCRDAASERYAIALGRALQLTNILRDVREDFENGGRIYLPLDDLARFGYSENDLCKQTYDERFQALMHAQADRAEGFFQEAADALPSEDRRALLPARIMGEIYRGLLSQMRNDGFQVFQKRYRVSKSRKLAILAKHLIAR